MSDIEPGAEPSATPSAWARVRDRDHTRGSLVTSLTVLALPLLATSFAAALYQLLDLSFISRLGEEATTAVIVTNQSLRQVFMILVMGAGFGAQGLIARNVGQGSIDSAEHAAGQLVMLGALLAFVVGGLGALFARELLSLMAVSPEVLELGIPYVRLVFGLSFAFVFVMLASSILGGAGDATTPMLISLLQFGVSAFAEWVLIFGHGPFPAMGISGVALGMVAGQGIALVLAGAVLFRGASRVHVRLHHLVPDPKAIANILRFAWPPALQMLGGFVVAALFIRLCGSFGSEAQAAYSIGLRLGMVGPMMAFPVAGACATLVGQSLGSGDVRRAWRALAIGLAAHAALLWSIAAALFLFRVQIVSAFASDPDVIALGSELLLYQAGAFMAFGLYFVFFRALQGAGDVLAPMMISVGNAVLVTGPLGYWLAFERELGPTGLFMATFIGAITVTVATGAWVATGRWTSAGTRRQRA